MDTITCQKSLLGQKFNYHVSCRFQKYKDRSSSKCFGGWSICAKGTVSSLFLSCFPVLLFFHYLEEDRWASNGFSCIYLIALCCHHLLCHSFPNIFSCYLWSHLRVIWRVFEIYNSLFLMLLECMEFIGLFWFLIQDTFDYVVTHDLCLFLARNDIGISGKGTLVVSAPGSYERYELCPSLNLLVP